YRISGSYYYVSSNTLLTLFIRTMSPIRRKQRKSSAANHSSSAASPESARTLVTLAPELFIKICAELSPKDLLSLAQVCRSFHSYLTSENSTSTNLIWKQA